MKLSDRSMALGTSAIRAASIECAKRKGINLGQGISDMPVPELLKARAQQAIADNKNTYARCEGIQPLRDLLARKYTEFNQLELDGKREVMVTHGATGAFQAAIMTLFNPGDEIIMFEPYYGYHIHGLGLHGIKVKTIAIDMATQQFSLTDLEQAIGPDTRGILLCTPSNPCGKVFTRSELESIADIAKAKDLWIIADEVYERITYPGFEHVSMATLPGCFERTVTISAFSKTYHMTGWRLGFAAAPAAVIERMTLVQDFMYVCTATPLVHGVLACEELPASYYQEMDAEFLRLRDKTTAYLDELGMSYAEPQGAYFLMADVTSLGYDSADTFAADLLERANVAVVPGQDFYSNPELAARYVRLCYAVDESKLDNAFAAMKSAGFGA